MTLPLMNIGGLASGLDTNAIIAGLIDVERIPLQNLESRKAGFQAKDDAWQQINTKVSAVRTALNAVDSLSDFQKFVTAASSNETAVTATATGAATPGTLSFTVTQLAANHQTASATNFTGADALVGAGDFTLTVGGTDHVITADASTTLADLAAQINALDVGVRADVLSVDGTNHKLMLSSDDTGAANAFTTSSTIGTLGSMDVVQQGTDAVLTIGSGPGALTVSRSSNTVTDLIQGVSLELKETTTSPVSVSVGRDIDAAVGAIKTLVDEVNAALTTVGSYTAYDADTQTGGVLVGDSSARSLVNGLRSVISGAVNDASANYPIAASVGISINRTGTFDFDETKLRDALEADFDEVTDLFLDSGSALDTRLSFVSAGTATVPGDYEVVVTQAATAPTAQSANYKKPKNDTTFQIIVDSLSVDVTVLKDANVDTAVQNINDALTAAGVASVTASKVQVGGKDRIQLDHSGFGSAAQFQVVGDPFSLAGTYAGTDVAGTIGGQAATGVGRLLTADAGDPSGLAVKVTASAADVAGAGGSLSLGNVTYSQGVGGSLDRYLDTVEGADGAIARARETWQAQIDYLDDRIEDMEDRIDRKEAALLRQFAALETAMATLSSQAAWLAAQLPGLSGGTTGTNG